MKKFHNLTGQDLLRHNIIENRFQKYGFDFVVSDSVSLNKLIILFFSSKKKIVFHFLELYTFCYTAFYSELKFRVCLSLGNPVAILKILIYHSFLLIKVILFKLVIKKNSILILSSELRKEFVKKVGFKNSIFVLRNKPVYTETETYDFNAKRIKKIALTGNLNNRKQFSELCKKLENTNIRIYTYGISKADQIWIAEQGFENVVVCGSIPNYYIPYILSTSSHAICLYCEASYNQKFSASSKIFEILYWGATPIVCSNIGLLSELCELDAQYIKTENLNLENFYVENHAHNLYKNNICLFSSDINKLKIDCNL